MKAMTWSLFYAVIGGLWLTLGAGWGVAFYLLEGMGFLALGVWEAWSSVRGREDKSGWRPTLDVGLLLIAAANIYRAVSDPTGFNAAAAACWAILGAACAVKLARRLWLAKAKKKEAP